MNQYDKKIMKRMSNQRVRKLHRCPKCQTPKLLRLLFKWRHGGVISLRLINPDLRFAFLDNGLLNEILDLLSNHFGKEEVYEIAKKTEKASACGYTSMLFGINKRWMKPLSFLVRYSPLMGMIMETNVTLLGYGAVNEVSIGVPNFAYTRNPYNSGLFQADLEGVFLVIRERDAEATVDTVSEEASIYVYGNTVTEARQPGICKQYEVKTSPFDKTVKTKPLPVCPRCKIPKQVGQLWWDPRSGVIVHRETGKRFVLWPCYALEQLLSTFVEHLGEEAEIFIVETVKEYEKRNIESDGIGFSPEEKLEFVEADKKGKYELLLRRLASMGYGYGEVELEDGKVKITMTNPLIPLVSSGLVAGMAEALEDDVVNVSWEESAEGTTYTLKTLGDHL